MALIFFVTLLSLYGFCFGAQHKVGDSLRWTLQDVNYNQWASSKSFQLGDTLVFLYNKQVHNMMQVSQQAFQSCDAGSPIASHNSGSVSIQVWMPGELFFICGAPGHCQAGMKVRIKISSPTVPKQPNQVNNFPYNHPNNPPNLQYKYPAALYRNRIPYGHPNSTASPAPRFSKLALLHLVLWVLFICEGFWFLFLLIHS